jgi:hypothetical protein
MSDYTRLYKRVADVLLSDAAAKINFVAPQTHH